MNRGQTNVHIYPSTFTHESRILKITRTLVETGVFEKILVLARWASGLAERESIDEKREVWRIGRKLGDLGSSSIWKALGTLEWSLRLLLQTRGLKVSCINCHSLPVLPLCVVLKFIKRSPLIYDTHELETETNGLSGLRQRLAKLLERSLIRFVDETVVVNDSIGKWYQREYGLDKVWVVRNVPYRQNGVPPKTDLLRKAFNIGPHETLYLYQGIVAQGRGIELMLNVFARAKPDKHLVIMGFGSLVNMVQEHAQRHPNIHMHDAVKPDDVAFFTSSADVGIFVATNVCLSYYLSLPNKLFEYLNCGLPLLFSDFPEFKDLITTYDCGWVVPPDEKEVAALVERISAERVAEKRRKAIAAREFFGWHLEEATLLEVYHKLGLHGTSLQS